MFIASGTGQLDDYKLQQRAYRSRAQCYSSSHGDRQGTALCQLEKADRRLWTNLCWVSRHSKRLAEA